jgi:hypothetical protein
MLLRFGHRFVDSALPHERHALLTAAAQIEIANGLKFA